jgi:hypothetical protein
MCKATCIVLLAGFACVLLASDTWYSRVGHNGFSSHLLPKVSYFASYDNQPIKQYSTAPVQHQLHSDRTSNHIILGGEPLQQRPSEVVVAHRGVSWWLLEIGPHWTVPCSWRGQPLACEYVSTTHAAGNDTAKTLLHKAHALVNEDCWDPADVPRMYSNMTQIMFSMEPHTTRRCFDQQVADVEMTYRQCSQVWFHAASGRRAVSLFR